MYHESVFIGANDHPSQVTTNAADKTYAELDRLLATGGPPANTNFLPPSQDILNFDFQVGAFRLTNTTTTCPLHLINH